MHQLVVLIPAYKPTHTLTSLAKSISSHTEVSKIVVIDDGGGTSYADIFKSLASVDKVVIFHNAANLGKGRSIKNGLNYILTHYPNCHAVVTADADGQHLPEDIIAVGRAALENSKNDLVLGCRVFGSNVPLRSKLGNILTSKIFKFLIGLNIGDTQTGLRGINKKVIPHLLTIGGERYEYETNMLIESKIHGWNIKDIPITTVYIENNKSSHFNPITDSMKIYFLIFRFLSSSIFSSSLDFGLFALFTHLQVPLMSAVLLSRFISGWINFYLNKNLVFKYHSNIYVALIRYWSLVLVMGILSSTMVASLENVISNVLMAKLLVECILFIGSFSIQKEFIFLKAKTED